MATTPLRNVRVGADLWARARTRAEQDGTNLSAVIVAALERYVGADDEPHPHPCPCGCHLGPA